jgi:hypothetical protein
LGEREVKTKMRYVVTLEKPRGTRTDEHALIFSYLKSLAKLSGTDVVIHPGRHGDIEITSESQGDLRQFMQRSQIDLLKPEWKQVESARER